MCFRPTSPVKQKICSKCGAVNPGIALKCKACNQMLDTPEEPSKKEEEK